MMDIRYFDAKPACVAPVILALVFLGFQCKADKEEGRLKPQDEYTQEKPGEWKAIASDHVFTVTVERNKSFENIKISLPETVFDRNHYIERIGVMDENKRDVAGKSLKRSDPPVVRLTINPTPDGFTKMKIYAKCNLHDLWTEPLARHIP